MYVYCSSCLAISFYRLIAGYGGVWPTVRLPNNKQTVVIDKQISYKSLILATEYLGCSCTLIVRMLQLHSCYAKSACVCMYMCVLLISVWWRCEGVICEISEVSDNYRHQRVGCSRLNKRKLEGGRKGGREGGRERERGRKRVYTHTHTHTHTLYLYTAYAKMKILLFSLSCTPGQSWHCKCGWALKVPPGPLLMVRVTHNNGVFPNPLVLLSN